MGVAHKAQSNVPWTRKSNAQPVKKEIHKIQTVKNNETTAQISAPVIKENNEDIKIESRKSCEEDNIVDQEAKTQITAVDVVESSEKVPDTDVTDKASCSAEIAKTEAEETEVKVKESDSKVKVSELETARRSVSPSNNCASESSSEVEWEMSEEEEEVVPSKPTSPVKENSCVVVEEEPLSKREPVIATKEIPSLLLMSPMVRRRGETVSNSNCVSVSANIRLPPPPSFRPPPPPVSPPVPANKVKDLANERSLGLIKKDESSEEEESEWEYETESEEE